MKKELKEIFFTPSFWFSLFTMYATGVLFLWLKPSIWMALGVMTLTGLIFLALLFFHKIRTRRASQLNRKIKALAQKTMKANDPDVLFDGIIDELLPLLRKELPQVIYKYYSLGGDSALNERKFDSLSKDMIWMSKPSQFNDPFEGNFMYLDSQILEETGFPPKAAELWNYVTGLMRQSTVISCFSMDPDAMPMWAHYANNHHGFCVAYQVNNPSLLYPVFYSPKRLPSFSLFVKLIYELSSKEPIKFKSLRYFIFLSAFKDASWKSEHEVRAITLSTVDEISNGGCLYSCEQLGLRPTKIYAGVLCDPQHASTLEKIAADKKIEYEHCELSRTSFSVVK